MAGSTPSRRSSGSGRTSTPSTRTATGPRNANTASRTGSSIASSSVFPGQDCRPGRARFCGVSSMKVLVTGGAGYIGSTLVPLLLEHGCEVTVLDSLLYGIGPILPLFRDPRFSLVRGDIRDRQVVDAAARDVDAMVHLAAVVGYPACAQRPDDAQATNVEGTRNLAAAAGRSRPIVFASTSSCY